MFRIFFKLIGISIRSSISLKAAFIIETILMLISNILFLIMWFFFFEQFKEISGWKMSDMMIVMAIVNGADGIMRIFFGGLKNLSRIITNGDLDSFMLQPVNLLLHVVSSNSLAKGWGQLLTTIILIILGHFMFSVIILIIIGLLCGAMIFTSINIIAHSLTFWFGPIESISQKYCDSFFLFAFYPTNIYSGVLKVVLFTIIPAGIISYIPVELIHNFSFLMLAILFVSSALFLLIAFSVFYLGLRKYESGNNFCNKY